MKRAFFVLMAVAALSTQAFAAGTPLSAVAGMVDVSSSGRLIEITYYNANSGNLGPHFNVIGADGSLLAIDPTTASYQVQVGGSVCDYSKQWQITNDGNLYCIAK